MARKPRQVSLARIPTSHMNNVVTILFQNTSHGFFRDRLNLSSINYKHNARARGAAQCHRPQMESQWQIHLVGSRARWREAQLAASRSCAAPAAAPAAAADGRRNGKQPAAPPADEPMGEQPSDEAEVDSPGQRRSRKGQRSSDDAAAAARSPIDPESVGAERSARRQDKAQPRQTPSGRPLRAPPEFGEAQTARAAVGEPPPMYCRNGHALYCILTRRISME